MFQASLFPCSIHQVQRTNSFPTLVSVDKCLPDFFHFADDYLNLWTKIYSVSLVIENTHVYLSNGVAEETVI